MTGNFMEGTEPVKKAFVKPHKPRRDFLEAIPDKIAVIPIAINGNIRYTKNVKRIRW